MASEEIVWTEPERVLVEAVDPDPQTVTLSEDLPVELIAEDGEQLQLIVAGGPRGPKGDTGEDSTVPGPPGPPGPAGDGLFYRHVQGAPAAVWTVEHGFGHYPGGIVVIDSGGSTVIGDISYPDVNTVQLTFTAPFSGTASIS